MTASSIALRLVFQMGLTLLLLALLIGPFAIFYAMTLGLPAILVSLAVFAPIEVAVRKRGWQWLSIIPMVGAAIPWLLFPRGDVNGLKVLMLAGFCWGLLWVISAVFQRPPTTTAD